MIYCQPNSSVGISEGWTTEGIEVRFPAGTINFSFLHRVQTGFEAHPAFYPMGTWGLNGRGVKVATRIHLVPRLRMMELYLHCAIRIYGVVLN
jgi:hypothetical protein